MIQAPPTVLQRSTHCGTGHPPLYYSASPTWVPCNACVPCSPHPGYPATSRGYPVAAYPPLARGVRLGCRSQAQRTLQPTLATLHLCTLQRFLGTLQRAPRSQVSNSGYPIPPFKKISPRAPPLPRAGPRTLQRLGPGARTAASSATAQTNPSLPAGGLWPLRPQGHHAPSGHCSPGASAYAPGNHSGHPPAGRPKGRPLPGNLGEEGLTLSRS